MELETDLKERKMVHFKQGSFPYSKRTFRKWRLQIRFHSLPNTKELFTAWEIPTHYLSSLFFLKLEKVKFHNVWNLKNSCHFKAGHFRFWIRGGGRQERTGCWGRRKNRNARKLLKNGISSSTTTGDMNSHDPKL